MSHGFVLELSQGLALGPALIPLGSRGCQAVSVLRTERQVDSTHQTEQRPQRRSENHQTRRDLHQHRQEDSDDGVANDEHSSELDRRWWLRPASRLVVARLTSAEEGSGVSQGPSVASPLVSIVAKRPVDRVRLSSQSGSSFIWGRLHQSGLSIYVPSASGGGFLRHRCRPKTSPMLNAIQLQHVGHPRPGSARIVLDSAEVLACRADAG